MDAQAAKKAAEEALADQNLQNLREAEEILRGVVDPIFAEAAKAANANDYRGTNRLITGNVNFQQGGSVPGAVLQAELTIAPKNQAGNLSKFTIRYLVGTRLITPESSISVGAGAPIDFTLATPGTIRQMVDSFLEDAVQA